MATKPNVSVDVRDNEPIERALRRFKRQVERAGIKRQIRRNRFHEKPSDERRRAERKLVRNKRRADRKLRSRVQRKLRKVRHQANVLGHMEPEALEVQATVRRQDDTTSEDGNS